MGLSWDDFYNPLTSLSDSAAAFGKYGTKGANWIGKQFGSAPDGTDPGTGSLDPNSAVGAISAADQAQGVAPPGGSPQGTPQGVTNLQAQTGLGAPVNTNDNLRKNLLSQQAAMAGRLSQQAQGNYNQLGQQGNASLAALQAQAQGQNSVSAEQLRQALGQSQAQQMSMAAGASPANAAGAARTAAIQMGRNSAGLAGQQATAGLAERNQAQQQYAQQLQGLRQQDMSTMLGSQQTAIAGYGAGNAGAPTPSWIQQYGPAIASAAGYAASDRRLKTDIKDGDSEANKAIKGLAAYTYKYKDPDAHGPGQQLGTTTQDLTKAGLGQAVIDTPGGQYIHAGKLAGANTAMIAALGRRVATIEDAARGPAQEPGDMKKKQRMMQVLAGRDAGRSPYRGDNNAGTYSTDGGGE